MNTETEQPNFEQMRTEVATRIMREQGADQLMETLNSIEGALVMHAQDVQRGVRNENPEKFRWRVNPTTAARLRKERKQVEAEMENLLNKARAEAARIVEEAYGPQAADPAKPPQTQAPAPVAPDETTPTLEITKRPRPEQEAVPKPPVPEAA